MAAEVVAVILNSFVRHHRGVGHRKDAQKRRERLCQLDLESGVVQGSEGIMVIVMLDRRENPKARGIQALVNHTVEGIDEVLGGDIPRSLSLSKGRLIKTCIMMKRHIITQMKGINLAILADVPRLGHHRDEVHLVVEGHKTVEHLVAGPDVRQVLGIDRVESENASRFIVLKDSKTFLRILAFAARNKQQQGQYPKEHLPHNYFTLKPITSGCKLVKYLL